MHMYGKDKEADDLYDSVKESMHETLSKNDSNPTDFEITDAADNLIGFVSLLLAR